jgi:DNA-binding response OmpR family regulator
VTIPAAREEGADVLVVDDDPTVAEVVAAYLRRTGHEVRLVADGPGALAAASIRLPDLVVLDLMLPGFDGFEVFRRIRQLGPVSVIMLTARTSEQDRILGLELGADDYVTKPFSPRELALRVRSVLRRADRTRPPRGAGAAEVLRLGPLEVDVARHEARYAGALLSLTVREYDLLAFLVAHPGQVYTRAELMRQVWGWEFGDQSTVTVHVRRLREKIEPDPATPRSLVTVWGVGYRLDGPETPEMPETRGVSGVSGATGASSKSYRSRKSDEPTHPYPGESA